MCALVLLNVVVTVGSRLAGIDTGCSFFGKPGTDFLDANLSVVTMSTGPPFASCCAACASWNRQNSSKGRCAVGVVYGAGTHAHPRLPAACALKAGSTKTAITGHVTAVAPTAPQPPAPAPSPAPPPSAAFRFASSYGDGMVLQAAPSRAMVWGFCKPDASVTVKFGAATVQASVNGTEWTALLPATPSSMADTHSIMATSGSMTISLKGVLFGDVWVCSGQSNMQYPVGKPGCWNPSNPNCTSPANDPQCVCSPRGEYPSVSTFPHGCGCINQTGVEVTCVALVLAK